MFFYLSFLRPPPTQALPYGSISLTPQISNDLRTEQFEGTKDLYYTWVLDSDPSESRSNISTKPTKLTTWRLSSAYKEIPVPIPASVREGQKWRLILTCQADTLKNMNPESIDLSDSRIGSVPFPVSSMPILFSSTILRGKQAEWKQVMIARTYMIPFKPQSPPIQGMEKTFLHFSEQTSYDLDKKIWDSGIGLSSWLCGLKENEKLGCETLKKLRSTMFSDEQCRIVELGAGIGMVSVVLAVLRSTLNPSNQDIIMATDVDTAMPLLQQNILANSRYYHSVTPQALVLDWNDEELPPKVCELGGLDIIVMSDVSYNTASFPALSRTLSSLVRFGPNPPLIILGYKERDEAERDFWDMTAGVGIHFEKVGERTGAGGAPVEVWLGRYSSSDSK